MIMLMGVALWAISAPSGFVVGEVAREHFLKRKNSQYLSWMCAMFPPAAAAIALALILKAELNED